MPERLNLMLNVRVGEVGPQKINVRNNLQVNTLINTIKDKFNLDGAFELRMDGATAGLRADATLDAAGVKEGATVICARLMESTGTLDLIRAGTRLPFSKRFKRAFLKEERTLTEFDLLWQPAVIGRKDYRDPANNKLLAVDLEGTEQLPTVSRHHACITESGGSFYIEDVQGRNPVFVDGKRLAMGARHQLTAGAVIRVGRVTLTFKLVS